MSTSTDQYLGYDSDGSADLAPPPRRPRRWLTPRNAALVAVALGFDGFYAGIREEKANATGSAATRSASVAAASRPGSAGSPAAAGAAPTSAASSSGLTTGTVTRVAGDTVYIKSASGNTVEVKLLPTTTISKTLSVSGHTVRPGDTVAIQGTQSQGGTIKPAAPPLDC